MEKPKLEISSNLNYPTTCNHTTVTINGITQVTQRYQHSKDYQFKLKNPLKYVFNPALDIKDYSIDGSVVLEFETVQGDTLVDSSSFLEGSFINAVSSEFPGVNNTGKFKVGSIPIPIGGLQSFASQFRSIHRRRKSFSLAESELYKLDSICSANISDIDHNNYTRPVLKNAYLKLSIEAEFNDQKSNGEPHKYDYHYTYKIDVDDYLQVDYYQYPLISNLQFTSINLSNFKYNLELNSVNFNGQYVNGCVLENNTYLCKAENNVQLQGDFNVATGYEVIIQAANEILALPETVLPPEMTLQIASFFDISNPLPPVHNDSVTTFCKDESRYQAGVASKSLGKMGSESDDEKSFTRTESETEFAFNIYPNPTSGSTTVSITLEEAAQGELFITDINGRRLESAFDNRRLGIGQSEHQLPTQTLSPGIYLVHLFVNGEHHVKRLVKQ